MFVCFCFVFFNKSGDFLYIKVYFSFSLCQKAATTLPSQASAASAGAKQTPMVPSNVKKTALKTTQPANESSEDESDSEEEPAVKVL